MTLSCKPTPAPGHADPTRPTRDATLDVTDPERFRHGFDHALFRRLRQEAPVLWQDMPAHVPDAIDDGFWVVSRYADIQAINRDTERFSALDGPGLAVRPEMRGTMLPSMDGEAHHRLRRLVSSGFTPRMIGRLETQARAWARHIVRDALDRERCNFVDDVAYQLPMHMIADIMGIPISDRAALFGLVKRLLAHTDPESGISREEAEAVRIEMFQYGQALGRDKRANPRDDVWTKLATAEITNEAGGREALGEIELDLFFLVLTIAGSETTRNAISLGLLALLENPDQLASLRGDPARLAPAAEEILRFTSPASYFARRATRDTEIRGTTIAEGDRVTIWYPSGNRDEEVFDAPDRFDIDRERHPHLSFGGGGHHFCLGANLARREIEILFETLFAHVSEIELDGPPVYSVPGLASPVCVSLAELPVRLVGA